MVQVKKSTHELDHEKYMMVALAQAQRAFVVDEVPIGAVIIDEYGVVIARAYNSMEKKGCQTGHAEVKAIEKACRKVGNWRLDKCWIYVTLEPCVMCFGLIALSRFAGVVYGATSPLFGIGLEEVEKLVQFKQNLILIGGLKKKESIALLQDFFKKARNK